MALPASSVTSVLVAPRRANVQWSHAVVDIAAAHAYWQSVADTVEHAPAALHSAWARDCQSPDVSVPALVAVYWRTLRIVDEDTMAAHLAPALGRQLAPLLARPPLAGSRGRRCVTLAVDMTDRVAAYWFCRLWATDVEPLGVVDAVLDVSDSIACRAYANTLTAAGGKAEETLVLWYVAPFSTHAGLWDFLRRTLKKPNAKIAPTATVVLMPLLPLYDGDDSAAQVHRLRIFARTCTGAVCIHTPGLSIAETVVETTPRCSMAAAFSPVFATRLRAAVRKVLASAKPGQGLTLAAVCSCVQSIVDGMHLPALFFTTGGLPDANFAHVAPLLYFARATTAKLADTTDNHPSEEIVETSPSLSVDADEVDVDTQHPFAWCPDTVDAELNWYDAVAPGYFGLLW